MVRRVAVIGAGCSGLACVKHCVDEGLEVVCFESSDDIGGLWRFKESCEKDQSNIYRSLVTNTSKEMMCFSDFPMPAHFPNYMHNSQVLQYLRLYVEHFDLLKYLHFQTRVRCVVQRPNFSESGQWEVVTSSKSGEETSHVFDGVLVCSGQYNKPSVPLTTFPGHKTFTGQCLHSWEYRDAEALRGKRVVIVGIGNSGGDIAVEVSRVAAKTFLSTRKGVWVLGRTMDRGLPSDLTSLNRLNNVLISLPIKMLMNSWIEAQMNRIFDHDLYGLKPSYRFLDRKPLLNSDLPGRILQGAIFIKPNVKEFRGSTVVFEDGSEEEDVDSVVFCTGYQVTYPFLPQTLTGGPDEELKLYKRVFFPSLQPPTLAIIGLFNVNGPNMPIMEIQARWAVQIFTGSVRLPPADKMLAVIEQDKKSNKSYPSHEASIRVNYIQYLDFLAGEVGETPLTTRGHTNDSTIDLQIGVRPNLLRLVLTDPRLWSMVFFGPCTPFQYRLFGPGRWAEARHAILTQWSRVQEPLRGGVRQKKEPTWVSCVSRWLFGLGGLLIMTQILIKHNDTLRARLTQCLDSGRIQLR